MNSKTARALRKAVRISHPDKPYRSYKQINQHPKVIGFDTLADGSKQPIMVEVSTTVLDPDCQRAIYQQAKQATLTNQL